MIDETVILLDIFLGIRNLDSMSFSHGKKPVLWPPHRWKNNAKDCENDGGRRAIVPINNTNDVAKNRSTNINDIARHFTELLLLLNNNLVAEANRE